MLRVIEKEPDVLFTDGDLWPPQTFMLNAIRDWITDCPFDPHTALGIDRNPTLIEILTSKWPNYVSA